jgi:hypothetical protein
MAEVTLTEDGWMRRADCSHCREALGGDRSLGLRARVIAVYSYLGIVVHDPLVLQNGVRLTWEKSL